MPLRSTPVLSAKGLGRGRPVPLNVLLPMGGLESNEFTEAGYRVPKPMVPIVGRPMIFWLIDNLALEDGDHVWMGLQRSVEAKFAIEREVRREYPSLELHVVLIDFETRGVTETLFCILNAMDERSRERRTISLDSDTVWFCDVLGGARALPPRTGASFCFQDTAEDSSAPYSYMRVDEATSEILEIREKVAISRLASGGGYVFPSGNMALEGLEAMLDEACAAASAAVGGAQASPRGRRHSGLLGANVAALQTTTAEPPPAIPAVPWLPRPGGPGAAAPPEPPPPPVVEEGEESDRASQAEDALVPLMERGMFVSGLITHLMAPPHEVPFLAVRAHDLANLGSPARLKLFVDRLRRGEVAGSRPMRFCFGLDGTLLKPGPLGSGPEAARPMEKNVAIVRELHEAGHTIIIWTRRGGGGGKNLAQVGRLTFDQLEQFGVPYDEIVFGQPDADLYVDARACSSLVDLDRALGWEVAPAAGADAAAAANTDLTGGVKPRHFNSVRRVGEEHVEKTGPRALLRGEAHWYRHIPPSLADIFPHALAIKEHPAQELSSILLTRVAGVTYSHLVVNACLTGGRLRLLLEALKRIHFCERASGSPTHTDDHPLSPQDDPRPLPDDLICSNYRAKVDKRFEAHRALFRSFDEGAEEMAEAILTFLGDYEAQHRFRRADYIHGDPVFSNVLLTTDSRLKLLDMRGALGDTLTTEGDVNYDLSKVYQSLCGYDFIILDHDDPPPGTEDALRRLRAMYEQWLAETYDGIAIRDIRILTAAHFFCIVPLHDNLKHQRTFLHRARAILAEEGLVKPP